jgi:hypothetical protein
MRRDRRVTVVPLLVGIAAAAISLLRLWLGDRSAITETLWAEDGLFPLCIHKAGFWECFTDPFAGYWLFLPRLLAWPVSLFPWEQWALVTNLLGAVITGAVAAVTVVVLRRAGMTMFVVVAAGLLPALAPIVGLESINALGSVYMPLLFLSTLLVAFPVYRTSGVGTAAVLLVTAMTIPSVVVLAPLLLVVAIRGGVRWRIAGVWLVALGIGLALQAWISLGATTPRSTSFTLETVRTWADAVPVAILTYWPGLTIGEYSPFTNFTLSPWPFTGWLVVGIMTLWGAWAFISGHGRVFAAGVLVISGLGLGLIPAAIGSPNNRYFVVPLLVWGVAALVLLDPVIRRSRVWMLALVTSVVLLIWWPAFPVSGFRAIPQPPWTSETTRVEARCAAEPDMVERPIFSHFWPPNWGDGLSEPTHPNLPCTVVWRWID